MGNVNLSGRLEEVHGQVRQASAVCAAAEAPRWKGPASGQFRERKQELSVALQHVSDVLMAARLVTAEFERAWYEERAARSAVGGV